MKSIVKWAALAALLMLTPARAQTLTEVTGFGSNPGNLKMFKIIPAGLPANAPLVVALHGCAQSAASYDAETGWVLLANRWKFALLLPQQQSGNNSSTCFNWFESGDISRGSGEALSIRQMLTRMQTDHATDPARSYVTGLSAGGAMAAVMLATYPEAFTGGAIIAGIPYRCGVGTSAAFSCMNPGSDLSPAQWGDKVRAASTHVGPWPVVSIWHGSSDTTVRPLNLTEAVQQWTNVHGVDQIADVEDSLLGYPRKVYRDSSGRNVVETISVTGMGHGTPVDPGSAETQCGTAGAYVLDANICSSYWIGRFWGLDNLDSQAPTVSLTAPTAGSSVNGTVTVSASANDNIGIERVEFLLDGALLGSDASAPYSISWNSALSVNGSHSLQARALDLVGNGGSSAVVSVTVSGGLSDTTPPSISLVFPTAGAVLSGSVSLSAQANDDFGVSGVQFLLDGSVIGSVSAAPWSLNWNSASVAEGSYAISARAFDAAGNSATSAARTISVSQNIPALDETFGDRDGNGDFADSSGWSGGFVADAANATVGTGGSQSAFGAASSGVSCATGLRTQSFSRSLSLGSAPRLSYARLLDLKASTSASYSAYFRVSINGTSVDERVVSYGNAIEADWVRRAGIDLSAWGGQTVSLRFEVGANANVCIEAWARANIDDIRIDNAQQAADTVAPTVNLDSPSNGSTLAGSVQLAASASDNIAVTRVQFFANGSLLGEDSSAPYTFSWNIGSVANGSYALMARALDAAGNIGSDADTTVAVNNSPIGGGSQLLSLGSVGTEDGYTKASATGGSAEVGALEASYGLAISRGSDSKHNRALLSFDTSALPDDAEILAATLTITHRGNSGDPWASPSGNRLLIDLRSGCFGGDCGLLASDHDAASTLDAVAEVPRFTSGTQDSTPFASTALSAINRSGRTQLRLRFESNPTATRYLWIGSGTQATLRIEYRQPD
ncbi:PHB depolymerase family esterase [Aquimonas sp.]|jgi:poly(hydroxyalkanoate) depolymerase family esterase|uniref:extracellular catalytic domain type 1 short-chain-length polyhydroxyalkanoate depolymerase n=1 Tax=Aquimonas sp. TaxID=1872588 RepID=UPI0037BF487B